MIYKFTIENEGKTYECEREVTGKVYGTGKHSASTMTSAARRIANEILHGI